MAGEAIDKTAGLPRQYPADADYLVGCSGGCDSIVLLDLLIRLGYRRLIVCHLDHRLRGADSAGDAQFVAARALELGLECELSERNVAELAAQCGLSIEAAGRRARFEFFAEVAGRRGCPQLMLAHHADDQVETVLMNLFRGAGGRGLGGMNEIATRDDGLTVIRPLLGLWREELREYARSHALEWREDSSNLSPTAVRNRVRHELLPMLREIFGRDVRSAVRRAASIAGAEDAFLEQLVDAVWETVHLEEALSVAGLRGQPDAVRGRIVHRWLRRRGVPDCDFTDVRAVAALAAPDAAESRINLGGGWRARRRAGLIYLDRPQKGPPGDALIQ
jgi:tRNA(Ile)-lysidine synthase